MYQKQVAELTTALTTDDDTRLKTHSIIRRLIDQMIVRPSDAEHGVTIEVSGRLASILALATGEELPAAMYAAVGADAGIRTLDPNLVKVSSTCFLTPLSLLLFPVIRHFSNNFYIIVRTQNNALRLSRN
jgi:hypothetical protein